jgi:hypothetical protein
MCVRRLRRPAVLGIAAAMMLAGCAAQPEPSGVSSAAPTAGSARASAAASQTASAPATQPSLQPSPDASPIATRAAAPSALRVDCTETGTSVVTDSVATQPDGVHFLVRSVARGRAFQIDGVGGDNAFASTELPPEETLVWAVPPGPIRIWCGPTDPAEADWVAVQVIDPMSTYVPVELTCASAAHGSNDYGAGARGEQGEPVAITRRHLRGLRPGDAVEHAGYPATAERKVRVVRDGAIAAVATYVPDGHGGWLIGSTDICAGTGISWPS